jgi:hypothetical protein
MEVKSDLCCRENLGQSHFLNMPQPDNKIIPAAITKNDKAVFFFITVYNGNKTT